MDKHHDGKESIRNRIRCVDIQVQTILRVLQGGETNRWRTTSTNEQTTGITVNSLLGSTYGCRHEFPNAVASRTPDQGCKEQRPPNQAKRAQRADNSVRNLHDNEHQRPYHRRLGTPPTKRTNWRRCERNTKEGASGRRRKPSHRAAGSLWQQVRVTDTQNTTHVTYKS
jgi:hypothetical protein